MARMEDVAPRTRKALEELECVSFSTKPWVAGPPLAERRVAIVSSAGIHLRADKPFAAGDRDYRAIPSMTPAADIIMSHVSVNYDRTGYQRDINVAFPIDRLNELAAEGAIGSVGPTHYSFMGATAPEHMEAKAKEVADLLKADGVDTVALIPV